MELSAYNHFLMREIKYTRHLELRLKLRNIPWDFPRKIYLTGKERYFDALTDKFIVVKRMKYHGKFKELAVAYEEIGNETHLITIHPLKEYQKEARIKSERWRKL